MYVIHRTQGFVLASFVSGEADRRYVILTEAFGRIEARARSVRLERSKLRYGLSPYTLGIYALVRGRSGWHIVGSHDEENFFSHTKQSRQKRKTIEHVAALLARLVVGEGKHEGLFASVLSGLRALVSCDTQQVEAVELVMVLRILYILGYISTEQQKGAALLPFVMNADFDEALLHAAQKDRQVIIRAINDALAASHL